MQPGWAGRGGLAMKQGAEATGNWGPVGAVVGDQDWGQGTWVLSMLQRTYVSQTSPLAIADFCRGWSWRKLARGVFLKNLPSAHSSGRILSPVTHLLSPYLKARPALLGRGDPGLTCSQGASRQSGERTIKVTITSNGTNND